MDVWSDIAVDRVRVPLESLIGRWARIEGGHQGVMRSDEPGIAAAPGTKPACAFPVAAVDHRLGRWGAA